MDKRYRKEKKRNISWGCETKSKGREWNVMSQKKKNYFSESGISFKATGQCRAIQGYGSRRWCSSFQKLKDR